jgi:hypothetical protein
MTDEFSTGPAPKARATMDLDLKILRMVLRLPEYVSIDRVETGSDGKAVLFLSGGVPVGKVIADMQFEHTTVVRFKGWRGEGGD